MGWYFGNGWNDESCLSCMLKPSLIMKRILAGTVKNMHYSIWNFLFLHFYFVNTEFFSDWNPFQSCHMPWGPCLGEFGCGGFKSPACDRNSGRCWAEEAGLSRRCWRLDGCQRWMSNVFLHAVPGWFLQCAGESTQPWPGGTINATVCGGKRGKCTWIWSTGGRQKHSLLHFDIRTWNLLLTSEHDTEMPIAPPPSSSLLLSISANIWSVLLKFWLICCPINI